MVYPPLRQVALERLSRLVLDSRLSLVPGLGELVLESPLLWLVSIELLEQTADCAEQEMVEKLQLSEGNAGSFEIQHHHQKESALGCPYSQGGSEAGRTGTN
jgi:hypothetical protein